MMEDFYARKSREYGIRPIPEDATVAMAYVPYQGYNPETSSPEQGLNCGTMFPELNKPFIGCGGKGNE